MSSPPNSAATGRSPRHLFRECITLFRAGLAGEREAVRRVEMLPATSEELPSRIHEVLRHWPHPAELAAFAKARHGFGDSNGGFGVTYPEGLDDNDRASGEFIPIDHVEIYGFWAKADGWKHHVLESAYLGCLANFLEERGYPRESQEVRLLQRTLDFKLEEQR